MDIHKSLRALFGTVSLIALGSPLIACAAGVDGSANRPAGSSAARQAVVKALDKKVSLVVHDLPLQELARRLSSEHHINILLDGKHLQDAGIDPTAQVRVEDLANVTLRSALRRVLASYEAAFVVVDDAILITTPEVADATLETHVYRVADLVPAVKTGGVFAPSGAARLIRLVQKSTAPQSWDENGGPGSVKYFDGRLVVRQTQDIQAAVALLLAGLSAQMTKQPDELAPVVLRSQSDEHATQRIDEALNKVVTLDFNQVPFVDALAVLERDHGLPISLDRKPLEDGGVQSDQAVSLHVTELPLRSALARLLPPLELAYILSNERFLITTPEIADASLEITLLPVADLVGVHAGRTDPRAGALLEIITRICAPQSWDDNGGPGDIEYFAPGRCLVVRQTSSIHEQVRGMLAQLRAAKPATSLAEAADPAGISVVVKTYDVAALAKLGGTSSTLAAQQLITPIKTLVSPKSWRNNAYIGEIGCSLVVSQTPEVHEEIAEFLKAVGPKSAVGPKPTGGGGGGGFGGGGAGGGFFAVPASRVPDAALPQNPRNPGVAPAPATPGKTDKPAP